MTVAYVPEQSSSWTASARSSIMRPLPAIGGRADAGGVVSPPRSWNASAVTSDRKRRFSDLVESAVDGPLVAEGLTRAGDAWTRQHDGFVVGVDVQIEKRSQWTFTVNFGSLIDGESAYLVGADLDASYECGTNRIAFLSDDHQDRWWVVTAAGITSGPLYGPQNATKGDDLAELVANRVIPALREMTDLQTINLLAEADPTVPPGRRDSIRSAMAWQEAGRPLQSVEVQALGHDSVLVEVSNALATSRPDLVESVVKMATPVELRLRMQMSRCAPPYVEFSCPDADVDQLRVRYQNWLSVRAFGPPIASSRPN